MFNPLVDSFDALTDVEVEDKILELNRKYFMTSNAQVQQQIAVLLDMYQEEARARRARAMQQISNNQGDSGLDDLINVS